jgi:TonB family protein
VSYKHFALTNFILLAAIGVSAQSSPDLRFGGHTLGEPADVFFSSAKASESKQNTKDYCKSLLDDAKTKERVEEHDQAAKNGSTFVLRKKDFSFLDVSNCRQVMAALAGDQASVGARLASELGKGTALFAYGRLSALNLTLDSSYAETLLDVERRFGTAGQKQSVARVGWGVVQETRWEKDGVMAAVWKNQVTDGAVLVVGVLEPPYDSFLRGSPSGDPAPAADLLPACKAAPSKLDEKVKVSQGVMAGLLLHRVQPIYPESAKQNRIEGAVSLNVTIDECGHVVELNPTSGPAELIPAASNAVKQWEYRPYVASGQPTAVETQVRVNFALKR